MKKYFLFYDEKATINYCFLFSLFLLAKPDNQKLNNTISFTSLKELQKEIECKSGYKISISSISKILNNEIYNDYFHKEENKIILNTNFKKGSTQINKFVVLNEKEVFFLLKQGNKLLNKYYLYLKYFCGYSKNKQIDSTAIQILNAIGYSANSGNNKYNLCVFNALLQKEGFINITKTTDTKGHTRNIYSIRI